jgi:hypothetical protein
MPNRGGRAPQQDRSALAESSSTEKVMPGRGGALSESSSTEKVLPGRDEASEAVTPHLGEPSLPAPHFPPVEESAVMPRPPAGEPQLPAPHFPPVAAQPAETEPDVEEPEADNVAEGLIPEPRSGEPEEISAIYVAAPERPVTPAAPVADAVETDEEPEQLELALALESDAVYLDPEIFPDRSMHIPYPRKATS